MLNVLAAFSAFSAGGEGGSGDLFGAAARVPGSRVPLRMGKLFREALVRSLYRFAFAGGAAAVLAATGCSSSSPSSSSGGTNWATTTTAAAGGGENALVAAAKKEGTLNVSALPPTWANYGTILSTFEKKYSIKVNSALPDGTSQQE